MQKVLTIRVKLNDDGTVAGIDRVVRAGDRLEKQSDETARATRRLSNEQHRSVAIAHSAAGALARVASVVGAIVGIGTIALLGRETFQYSESLKQTTNSIAGVLMMNRQYIGVQDQFAAATLESKEILKQLQVESFNTAATVPQLGDAFATTFGAATAARIKATNAELQQTAIRLTQAGSAFGVLPEQMRQEINSILSGMITEDSLIAKRLGLDNKSVKQMIANGTLLMEIARRTEPLAKAAEAQANTLSGKLINTKEIIVATLGRGLDGSFSKIRGLLDQTFGWFVKNGDAVVANIERGAAAIENMVGKTVRWARANQDLVADVAATAAIVGVLGVAFAVVTSPITLAMAAVVGLGIAWHHASQLSELQVEGRPVAAYMRATWSAVTNIWLQNIRLQIGAIQSLYEAVSDGVGVMAATGRVIGSIVSMIAQSFAALGRFITAPVRYVADLVGSLVPRVAKPVGQVTILISALGRVFGTPVRAAAAMVLEVGRIFIQLVSVIAAPLLKLVGFVAKLPAALLSIIPGAAQVKTAAVALMQSVGELFDNKALQKTFADSAAAGRKGIEEFEAALATTNKLAGPKDLVGDIVGYLRENFLPEMKKIGQEAAAAIAPSVARNTGAAAPGDDGKAQKKLAELLGDYRGFINDYRNAAAATDPLEADLAKIRSQREDAIARFEELQEKLKKALGIRFNADEARADLGAINSFFDAREVERVSQSLDAINRMTLDSARSRFEQETSFAIAEQQRQNEERIALISSAGEREVAVRLAAIEEWFAAEFETIARTVEIEEEKQRMLGNLFAEKERREQFARADVARSQREQLVGTREWARKMVAELGTVPEQVTRVIGQARLELAGMFDGIIDDLITGQADLGKSFEKLAGNLARTWGRMLSDMLTKTIVNGESIVSQLKAVWSQLNAGNPMIGGGGGDLVSAGLAGAGLGSFVGSLFGGPNNYGAEGGMIGGVIGAIVGTAFNATALGAAIGSAIGTAIGSMIQKGEDYIRVSIKNNVATVTEKGIDAQTRKDVEVQVQRRLKEQMKGWQSIMDLFPQHVRDMLAAKFTPTISLLFGGVEQGDISDAGALNALGDFLGNTLPKASFNAYKTSIDAALRVMGVESGKIRALFDYWGTLQGQELQDAVRGFVTTMLEGVDLRDKLAMPFAERITESRRLGSMTSLGAMDEVKNQIATVVASASKLTDIEDVIAAQASVNALARQYYDMGIARLQRIDAIEQNILTTNANIREQIDLAGMDDQGKMDYYYSRLADLRSTLTHSTDPEEIARITADMQKYIQQAFGLAPGSQENRDKLKEILGDIDGLAGDQLQKARAAQEAKDKEVLELQRQQLAALLGIQQAVGGPTSGGPGTYTGGDGPLPEQPTTDPAMTAAQNFDDFLEQIRRGVAAPAAGTPTSEAAKAADQQQYERLLDQLLGRAPAPDPTASQSQQQAAKADAQYYQRLIEELRGEGEAATGPDARSRPGGDSFEERASRALAQADLEKLSRMVGSEVGRALGSVRMSATFEEPIVIDNGDLGGTLEQRVTRNVVMMFTTNPDVATPRT